MNIKTFADFLAHFFIPTLMMLGGAFGLGCAVGARSAANAVKRRLAKKEVS